MSNATRGVLCACVCGSVCVTVFVWCAAIVTLLFLSLSLSLSLSFMPSSLSLRPIQSGRYDQGEYMTTAIHPTSTWDSSGAGASSKPYGASNAMEFFAETCEAFFSSRRFRNDFFPYVHAELRTFDPVAYKVRLGVHRL